MASGIGCDGVEGGGWGELQLRKMSDGLARAFIHRAISTFSIMFGRSLSRGVFKGGHECQMTATGWAE